MQQQIRILEPEPEGGMTGSQAFAFVLQRAIDASRDMDAVNQRLHESKQGIEALNKEREDLYTKIDRLGAQRDVQDEKNRGLVTRIQRLQAGDQARTDLYRTAERAMVRLASDKPLRSAERVDLVKDLKLALAAAFDHVDLIPF